METISETSQSKELKPWQKGFELDYLKDLEKRFTSYNEYAQHEMSKFKKNNIADALSKDEVLKELKRLQDKAKHQSGIEIDKSGKLITN